MEHSGESRRGVGSGVFDISKDIDLDRADLAKAQADVSSRRTAVQTAVDACELALEVLVGLVDGHPIEVERPKHVDIDAPLWRDLAAQGRLVGTEYVDYHLIARTQAIILRSSEILARSEVQVAVAEYVPAIDHRSAFILRGEGLRSKIHLTAYSVGAHSLLSGPGVLGLAALVEGADPFGLLLGHSPGG